MKKAKIMLMVVAILAVVGGSLGFKASRFTLHRLYFATKATADCSNPTVTFRITTTTTTNEVQPRVFYYSSQLFTTCKAVFTIPSP
jgi:hypothetical protein